MSVYRLNKNDFETFTIVTNPVRTYTSSSTQGATGSVFVFARHSDIEKETAPLTAFLEATHSDSDINASLRSAQFAGRVARNVVSSSMTASFSGMVSDYLNHVNRQGVSVRKKKVLDVIRFTPSFSFTSNTIRKLIVKDNLNKYYRISYPTAHWAYTNYNCLNFFTASSVPTGSALLYPNIDGGPEHVGYVSGVYGLSGAFSFDFYINPRYTSDSPDGVFCAGTIFHLSSSYALSLVSGSAKDYNGRPIGFRLKLQLSHSANVTPSVATAGTYPNNLIFLSDDNSLQYNNWHHVVVRWGTNLVNDGTGSFNIDGNDRGIFVVPSGTVAPKLFGQPPMALVVGNFYEGFDDMAKFFASDPATRDGIQQLYAATGVEEPSLYRFKHPLSAEVHDLAIKRYYMSNEDIDVSASVGPKSIDDTLAFYLPPFFVEESPFRKFVGNHGGILQTPFFEVDGTTNDPFNVALSFGVGGHYINIENFLRDFASNVFPRVHLLSGTAIATTTTARSANDFLYDNPLVRRRNLLIAPCDDGLFVPSYELLASESMRTNYRDDLGEELSFINLDNLISTASLLFGAPIELGTEEDDEDTVGDGLIDQLIGFTPEQPGLPTGSAYTNYARRIAQSVASGTFDPGIQDGAPLTIFQRTRDPSSNQVTFFDISNLFYGKRILPGTFEMRDPSLSGSGGAFGIMLRDDGRGNIYRADCLTSQSSWNSVGNIYYDEGIIVIKSPHLFFFGKEGYKVSFRGEQNIHVLKVDVLAPANQLNSSSSPDFSPVPPSSYANDPDSEFVYITGINFHDDNLNVVAKVQLAQPILKRHGEKLLFQTKLDF